MIEWTDFYLDVKMNRDDVVILSQCLNLDHLDNWQVSAKEIPLTPIWRVCLTNSDRWIFWTKPLPRPPSPAPPPLRARARAGERKRRIEMIPRVSVSPAEYSMPPLK